MVADHLRFRIEYRESQYALFAARLKEQEFSFVPLKVPPWRRGIRSILAPTRRPLSANELYESHLVYRLNIASLRDPLRLFVQPPSLSYPGLLLVLRLRSDWDR